VDSANARWGSASGAAAAPPGHVWTLSALKFKIRDLDGSELEVLELATDGSKIKERASTSTKSDRTLISSEFLKAFGFGN
jgi:hypothetical protein